MFVYELSGCGFESGCSHLKTSDFVPASSKKFLDIQATKECGFTLKHVRDMIRTYSHKPFFWQHESGQKKVVLFPKIGRVKVFLSLTHPRSQMCVRIYLFKLKKQQTNNKKQGKLLSPGGRLFSSPAFPETRVLFFWP